MSAVVLVSILGASVLNLVFPSEILFPAVLFSIVVALSLSRGFVKALPTVIAIGLVADVAILGRIGLLAAFSAGIAYSVSFFSRRFVVGHGFMTHVFAGLLIGAGAFLFSVASPLLDASGPSSPARAFATATWSRIPMFLAAGVLSFAVFVAVLRRFEEWLSYLEAPSLF